MKDRVLSLLRPLALACSLLVAPAHAATLATIETSLGTMELELFDADKPITVSNFVKYVTSGEYTNLFVQRWEPNFVIQAGRHRVTNSATGQKIADIPSFGSIKNEYAAGRIYSNTYGTIAMARQGGVVNSAGAEWFLNLTNNAFLDKVDEGFTVFGRVTSGTNVLNRFVPTPPAGGIYRVNLGSASLSTVPVLENVTTVEQLFTNLVYLNIKLRRDLNLSVSPTRPGQRRISWNTVAGVTNNLEYRSTLTGNSWITQTNFVGNGEIYSLIDTSSDRERIYRVTLKY